jgi:hypothetical protein
MKPTYFDFTVLDVVHARKLFQAVPGWRFERFLLAYGLIQTDPAAR